MRFQDVWKMQFLKSVNHCQMYKCNVLIQKSCVKVCDGCTYLMIADNFAVEKSL